MSARKPAAVRLSERGDAQARKAEAAVLAQEGLEVGLLVNQGLLRRAGGGGAAADGRPWWPEAGDGGGARGGEAGACGGRGGRWGRAPPPPRTLPAVTRAAAAEAQARLAS